MTCEVIGSMFSTSRIQRPGLELEICLQVAPTSNVCRDAMESATKSDNIFEVDGDDVEAPVLEERYHVLFARLNHNTLGREHQDIHAEPGARHIEIVPGTLDWYGRLTNFPILELSRNGVQARRMDQELSGTKWHQRCIDMHRPSVTVLDLVNPICDIDVSSYPLNAEIVRDMTLLYKDVGAATNEIGRVECRFEFCYGIAIRQVRCEICSDLVYGGVEAGD